MAKPSFAERKKSVFYETPVPDGLQAMFMGSENSYVRSYVLGECTVLVTKEFGRWHLSIAHKKRYPTWDEIAEARYRILPKDIVVAMILPPIESYVNLHKNCFQIVEIRDPQVNLL